MFYLFPASQVLAVVAALNRSYRLNFLTYKTSHINQPHRLLWDSLGDKWVTDTYTDDAKSSQWIWRCKEFSVDLMMQRVFSRFKGHLRFWMGCFYVGEKNGDGCVLMDLGWNIYIKRHFSCWIGAKRSSDFSILFLVVNHLNDKLSNLLKYLYIDRSRIVTVTDIGTWFTRVSVLANNL